jgi:hypothetical protein
MGKSVFCNMESNAITEDHFEAKVTERYQTHSLLAILLLHLLPCSHSRRGGMCVTPGTNFWRPNLKVMWQNSQMTTPLFSLIHPK